MSKNNKNLIIDHYNMFRNNRTVVIVNKDNYELIFYLDVGRIENNAVEFLYEYFPQNQVAKIR
jgi:hypothetical protein